MKTIAFFDLSLTGVKRYPLKLSWEMFEINNNISFVFFYEHLGQDNEENVSELLPPNSVIVKLKGCSHRYLKKILSIYDPAKLIVMGQRLPDSAIVSAAKNLEIETAMFQHGLYIPHMKREKSLFLKNIRKTFKYVMYAMSIARAKKASVFLYVFEYIKVFVFGLNILKTKIDTDFINADKVLVYGKYWQEYHKKNYGYRLDQQTIVGCPDFVDIPLLKNKKLKKAICYIAQTLVEDGRLPRKVMLSFVKSLSTAVKHLNVDLFIKLHPRSDISLYEEIKEFAHFEINDMPLTNTYIGHYSSLLVKTAFLSDKTLLIKFPGHDTPQYIKDIAKHEIDNFSSEKLEMLITSIMNAPADDNRIKFNKRMIQEYFDYKITNPFKFAAKLLI